MNIYFSCGILSSNTHIVWEEKSLEGMIIDCGVEVSLVKDFIEKNNIQVKYIVLTHGHYDHCEHLEAYTEEFSHAEIVCHRAELSVLYDIEANLSFWGEKPREYCANYTLVSDGDVIALGNNADTCMNFEILHTPGHTPGSMCLLEKKRKIMFTGDTLFKNSYGRVDFKYGNYEDMKSSLKRLFSLDESITFFPGHYGESTIKRELC